MQKIKLAASNAAQRGGRNVLVETLEGRQLLSAAFVEAGGRLVVRGTAGNDTITVSRNPGNSAQIRVLLNGKSFDFASKYVKQVRVEAGAGNDLVKSDTSKGAITTPMFFLGDAGHDTLMTSTADDALIGGGDSDVLIARAGNNYVNGGAGDDKIFAGLGNDTLVGEAGNDYLSDAGGKNTIVGAARGEILVKAALPTVIPSATGANPVPPSSQPPVPVTPTPPPSNSSSPFVIGVWSQPVNSFDKWKARGINTVVGYEGQSGTVSVEKFSAAAVADGLYMIRHPNADPAKDIGQKNLLAWMQNDEPDYHNTDPSVLQKEYAALKKVDPNKPIFVNFSGSSALWGYGGKTQADYQAWMKGADWIGNDLYPITAHNRASALDAPGLAVERLAQWSGGKRQMAVIEVSDQELSDHPEYPGVTAAQFRSEVFNAVISGATGIIYFPQRIGGGFVYDHMNTQVETEMKSVNARLARIGPALMSQKDPSNVGVAVSGSLQATWRKYGGKTYLIVLNNSTSAVTATMTTRGVSASSASVDGESRSVAIKSGKITDTFKPEEAHVYVVG
ncbi:MAG: hypothetical protein JWN40_6033 [Phycisphaerales bacterium]|nr:hypothetical protein [Phycisphaerales bacterium]